MFENYYVIEKLATLHREEIRSGIERQRRNQRIQAAARAEFTAASGSVRKTLINTLAEISNRRKPER